MRTFGRIAIAGGQRYGPCREYSSVNRALVCVSRSCAQWKMEPCWALSCSSLGTRYGSCRGRQVAYDLHSAGKDGGEARKAQRSLPTARQPRLRSQTVLSRCAHWKGKLCSWCSAGGRFARRDQTRPDQTWWYHLIIHTFSQGRPEPLYPRTQAADNMGPFCRVHGCGCFQSMPAWCAGLQQHQSITSPSSALCTSYQYQYQHQRTAHDCANGHLAVVGWRRL